MTSFQNTLTWCHSFYFNFITKRSDAAGPCPGPGLDSKAPVNDEKDGREIIILCHYVKKSCLLNIMWKNASFHKFLQVRILIMVTLKERVWRYEMFNWFISSHFYWIKLRFYNPNWNIDISSKRGNSTHQVWGVTVRHEAQLRLMSYKIQQNIFSCWHPEHGRRVGFGLAPDLLTRTDTQTQRHQDIEDQCLQEEHTKSCDRQRHQVHQRVCGQQHWLAWLSEPGSARRVGAGRVVRTGLQSVAARTSFIWNTRPLSLSTGFRRLTLQLQSTCAHLQDSGFPPPPPPPGPWRPPG